MIVARGTQPKRIYGYGGNDLICGSTRSRDRIFGGRGNDRIDGGGRGTLCHQQGGTGTIRRCAGPLRTLTVEKLGEGRVSSRPLGIDCGPSCSSAYHDGYWVSLVATPDPGMRFTGWDGACRGAGACRVRMGASRSVSATFEPQSHQLTVARAGTGSGAVTSDPAGIDCGPTCSAVYANDAVVVLTATPAGGAVFGGWSGCDSVAGAVCTVAMSGEKDVTATFTATYTLGVSVTGGGTVTSTPSGISCGSSCTATYVDGTIVTLTAIPNPLRAFVGWGGACSGVLVTTCEVTMDQARSVTATFTL